MGMSFFGECPECNGTGKGPFADLEELCPDCDGSGMNEHGDGPCKTCGGNGKVPVLNVDFCDHCNGSGADPNAAQRIIEDIDGREFPNMFNGEIEEL